MAGTGSTSGESEPASLLTLAAGLVRLDSWDVLRRRNVEPFDDVAQLGRGHRLST